MSNKTRKHIWSGALVMSIAMVGVLAAFLVLSGSSRITEAHGPPDGPPDDQTHAQDCAAMSDAARGLHDAFAPTGAAKCSDTGDTGDTGDTDTGNGMMMPAGAMLKSSSDTGSAGVKLTLIVPLTENLNSGSWVELYLEDDYQEPGDISTADVIFSATGGKPSTAGTSSSTTGDGGTFDASAVEIDDGGEIGTADDDVVVISAKIPDMDPRDDYYGYPGVGQTLTMVVRISAGIKNPSEAGSHSVGYSIIGGADDRAGEAGNKADRPGDPGQDQPQR